MEVEVRTEIRYTESPQKVRRAVLNFFSPDSVKIEEFGDYKILIAKGKGPSCLIKLYNALRAQKILDAARKYIKGGSIGNTIVFHLHKQAAYVGAISFCSIPEKESPLGAITFIITTNDIKRFIDWLTPRTIEGSPVGEAKPPDP